MRRRCEPRVAVALPVELRSAGRLLGRFTTRDLSRGGVALAASADDLGASRLLRAVVTLDGHVHRSAAVVRHAAGNRAGLLFADDADVLWGLLLEREPPLAAA